jgi:pectinesterase
VHLIKHHVILQGESRDRTIITGSVASLIYSCEHPGDINTAILNLDGNDITVKDLTVENSYGRTAPDSIFIDCKNSATGQLEKVKVIKTAHQFALKTTRATRLKVINCLFYRYYLVDQGGALPPLSPDKM